MRKPTVQAGVWVIWLLAVGVLLQGCWQTTSGLKVREPHPAPSLIVDDRRALGTLTPTFRWDAYEPSWFTPGKVENVRYHLVVEENPFGSNAQTVLDIDDLREPHYTPTTPLKDLLRYRWRVRAEYTVDGKPAESGWSTYRQCVFFCLMFYSDPLPYEFWINVQRPY